MNTKKKLPRVSAEFLLQEKLYNDEKFILSNENNGYDKNYPLISKLHKILPSTKTTYILIGIYIILSTLVIFSICKDTEIYTFLVYPYKFLLTFNILHGIVLISMPIWIEKSKTLGALIWGSAIILPLISIESNIILINKFNYTFAIFFICNLVILYQFFNGIYALSLITIGYIINVISFLIVKNKNIIDQVTSLNMIYSAFFMAITLIVFLLTKKKTDESLSRTRKILDKDNKKVSQELIKALEHQERFVYALDSECIEAFVTLHQISGSLLKNLENIQSIEELAEIKSHIMTLLSQNQHAANYLIQVIYQIKDHERLDVEKILISELLSKIQKRLGYVNNLNLNKIEICNQSNFQEITCDSQKIIDLILDRIIYFHDKCDIKNGLKVILRDTKLEYKVSFMKDYSKKIDALKIIITNDKQFIKDDQANYFGNTSIPSIVLPRTIDDVYRKFNERTLDAHYGASKNIIRSSGNTQIFVIPQNVRDVRPKVMDLVEIVIP